MIWRKLIQVYKTHFSKEELYSMFEKTIATIPKMSVFWLMYSKEVWKSDNNIVEAGAILNRSLEQLPKNVDIFLALIKLQLVSKNIKKAEELFQIARSTVENERIDYKYITFLRQTSTSEKSLTEVNKSLIKFPNCYKLYLQKSQILQESNDLSNARETLSIATKELPHETILWKHLSDIDLSLNNPTRARSDLDLAILKNPTSDDLWLHKLQLELKLRNTAQLSIILNTALQKFPHSSLIWDFNLRYIVTKAQRKVAYQDALSATNNDVRILLTIGVNFWRDGKVSKSKKWFERAIETDEDFGDAWAWLYDYLERQDHNEKDGIDEKRDFLQKFNNIEPSHGDVWPHVAKRLENLDKEPVELLRLVARELIESR
jgi:pre-mRNA-processing factor 6